MNEPVIAIAPTSTGGGYWLVAGEEGVFSVGDAGFSGSVGGHVLTAPVAAAMFDSGGGYRLVSSARTPVSFGAPILPAPPGNPTTSGAALFTA